jgi:flagellar hook protein FlgE
MVNFSANVSSLLAHQNYANANANNVANVNTDRFVPTQTTLVNSSQNSVQANFDLANDSGATQSQTDLSKELPDQVLVQKGHEVQGSAIRTQDEMLGTLLDIVG